MNVIRKFLKSRIGFTLVELMVVVVVLGILAGIAVQRMGDVRDRAETAAREANVRLLLGAANLALTRNYGDYMFSYAGGNEDWWGDYNATIRWQRPCDGPAVTQLLTQFLPSPNEVYWPINYISGYGNWTGDLHQNWGEGSTCTWKSNQEYDLSDYLESFPVGYAVEIVYAAQELDGGGVLYGANEVPNRRGYHQDRDTDVDNIDYPYNQDQIIIYKFVGDETEEPKTWDPFTPKGATSANRRDGIDYPYHKIYNVEGRMILALMTGEKYSLWIDILINH